MKALITLLTASLLLSACASHPPLNSTKFIDSERFLGDWYIISNIPYFAERGRVDAKNTYVKLADGRFQDVYSSRKGNFDNELKVLKGSLRSMNESNTSWKSTFFWVLSFQFDILHVDGDYQTMLLAHKSRKYGWVFSRNKQMDDANYQKALAKFTANGYDASLFKKVPQYPQDIGKDGYQ